MVKKIVQAIWLIALACETALIFASHDAFHLCKAIACVIVCIFGLVITELLCEDDDDKKDNADPCDDDEDGLGYGGARI